MLVVVGRLSDAYKEWDPNDPITVTSTELAGGISGLSVAIVFGSSKQTFYLAFPRLCRLLFPKYRAEKIAVSDSLSTSHVSVDKSRKETKLLAQTRIASAPFSSTNLPNKTDDKNSAGKKTRITPKIYTMQTVQPEIESETKEHKQDG